MEDRKSASVYLLENNVKRSLESIFQSARKQSNAGLCFTNAGIM